MALIALWTTNISIFPLLPCVPLQIMELIVVSRSLRAEKKRRLEFMTGCTCNQNNSYLQQLLFQEHRKEGKCFQNEQEPELCKETRCPGHIPWQQLEPSAVKFRLCFLQKKMLNVNCSAWTHSAIMQEIRNVNFHKIFPYHTGNMLFSYDLKFYCNFSILCI